MNSRLLDFDVHILLLLLSVAAAPPYAAAQMSPNSSLEYLSPSFDPSTAIILAVLVCVFILTGFLAVYISQCVYIAASDGANFRYFPSGGNLHLRLSVGGLDPSVIDSFPIFNYAEVKDLKLGKGALECAVCINEFEDQETLRLLPKCDHVFHPECIGAWLASHSTCPVCRANLTPDSGEPFGDNSEVTESNDSAEVNDSRHDLNELQSHNQISISVDEDQQIIDSQSSEVNPKQTRRRITKFPRSHSTGHSLVQPGENCERYTLRLPEEVRRQIMTQMLKRTTSCVFVLRTEGSSRRGYRSGGEGSSRRGYRFGGEGGSSRRRGDGFESFDPVGRSDRWVFTLTPPFLSRPGSVMSPKVGVDGETTAMGTSKMFLTSVNSPFDCMAQKSEQRSTRLPV
ncbi:RING-type E3 ubiquitin transferase [Sarracenia purpurea var. burkii]